LEKLSGGDCKAFQGQRNENQTGNERDLCSIGLREWEIVEGCVALRGRAAQAKGGKKVKKRP